MQAWVDTKKFGDYFCIDMLKRLVISVILFTMVLHSASRLGVLSYLYEQRGEIAYALGLLSEEPIAECGHDYDFGSGLKIMAAEDHQGTLPPAVLQAKEITLFIDDTFSSGAPIGRLVTDTTHSSPFIQTAYATPSLSIFHPPA